MAIQIEYKKPHQTAWSLSSETSLSPHVIETLEPVEYEVRAYDTETESYSEVQNVIASGGFIDTSSLEITAKQQGINITDNALYPRDTDDKPFSFEVWIKVTENITTNPMMFFKAIDSGNNNVLIQGLINSNKTVRFDLYGTSSSIRISMQTGVAQALKLNIWYHIVGTYTGSKVNSGLKLWINAVDLSAVPSSSGTYSQLPALTGSMVLQIPITEDTSTLWLRGRYSLFRWYDKALTESEIVSLYNAGEPRSINGLGIESNCLLEQRFNGSAESAIGTDGVEVGAINFTQDKPWNITNKSIIFPQYPSVSWPKLYKSSEWPEIPTTKPYFVIFSTDHADGAVAGIFWAECDDYLYNGFVERGKIVSGLSETPWLMRVPTSVSGEVSATLFLYYHTFTGGTPPQETRLIITTGGELHTATWISKGAPLGYVTGEGHTGYARMFRKANGTYVSHHVTHGQPSIRYAISNSTNGLTFTRGIEITGRTVGGYAHSIDVVPFEYNQILYGFTIIQIDKGKKIAVVTLDEDYLPATIVDIIDQFYTISILHGFIEGTTAYLNFKWSEYFYALNQPHYLLEYDLAQLD